MRVLWGVFLGGGVVLGKCWRVGGVEGGAVRGGGLVGWVRVMLAGGLIVEGGTYIFVSVFVAVMAPYARVGLGWTGVEVGARGGPSGYRSREF